MSLSDQEWLRFILNNGKMDEEFKSLVERANDFEREVMKLVGAELFFFFIDHFEVSNYRNVFLCQLSKIGGKL
jgi:hypothetical protein